MRLFFVLITCLCFSFRPLCAAKDFTVLQWNIWQEGTIVEGGYEAIVNEIVRLKPDFVTFSEVRNYNQTSFAGRITQALRERGETYYSFKSYDTGLLSRYPITDSLTVFPCKDDHGSVYRLLCEARGEKFAVYTAHLDYLNDTYYEVRGYDGCNWKPMPILTDTAEILRRNVLSQRDDAIRAFLCQAERDEAAGYHIILGGDFNEPSLYDWVESNRELYDHHGVVVPWTVTALLDEAGYIDAWRTLYPDPVTHPGFTYPADNERVPVHKLSWAPNADERERIDYIFLKGKGIVLRDARIFGPEGCIVRHRREPNPAREKFIAPAGIWPTDHKGLWVKFRIR